MQRSLGSELSRLAAFAAVFFLAIDAMGSGMKASFATALRTWLHDNGGGLSELASFVVGVLGTSLVQSSSTVTSLSVVLTQEGIVPLVISIGIVHGANLGTSVTSTFVAFFTGTRRGSDGHVLGNLLFGPRAPGFRQAVGTAVLHDMFNVILVIVLLLTVELPFGLIRRMSEGTAGFIGTSIGGSGVVLSWLSWLSPKTWTHPVTHAALERGLPGWALAIVGFVLLFFALRGFAHTMSGLLVRDRAHSDPRTLGDRLVGVHPLDTFVRGLVLTILVQSSSATTSMVVPLAAMGLFSPRRILPFILGANIGTTTTALLAAASAVGQPGFEAGLTIALAHLYLNTAAVLLVAGVPFLRDGVLRSADGLARAAERAPLVLVGYLALLVVVVPAVVFFLPEPAGIALLAAIVVTLLVGPRVSGAGGSGGHVEMPATA